VSAQETQLQQVVRLIIRARWFALVALIMAAVAAVIAYKMQDGSSPASYTAQAVALVRPPATFDLSAMNVEIENRVGSDANLGKPYFLQPPLGVIDYSLLLESDEVLNSVAISYQQQHPDDAVPLYKLKDMLEVITTLNAKTPYESLYYPTLIMQAEGPSREQALELARLWADVCETWTSRINRETREKTQQYINQAYEEQRATLRDLQRKLLDDPRDFGEKRLLERDIDIASKLLETLGRARLHADLMVRNPQAEFQIVSRPVVAVSNRRISAAPVGVATFVLAFLVLWFGALFVLAFTDIARSLPPKETE